MKKLLMLFLSLLILSACAVKAENNINAPREILDFIDIYSTSSKQQQLLIDDTGKKAPASLIEIKSVNDHNTCDDNNDISTLNAYNFQFNYRRQLLNFLKALPMEEVSDTTINKILIGFSINNDSLIIYTNGEIALKGNAYQRYYKLQEADLNAFSNEMYILQADYVNSGEACLIPSPSAD